MIDRKSYVPPFQIDQVLEGGAIGIEKSNSKNLMKAIMLCRTMDGENTFN